MSERTRRVGKRDSLLLPHGMTVVYNELGSNKLAGKGGDGETERGGGRGERESGRVTRERERRERERRERGREGGREIIA